MALKHILVATDFSDASNRALDMCRELARQGAKVSLVHAHPRDFNMIYPVPGAPVGPTKEQLEELKRRTEEALERLRGEYFEGVPFAHVHMLGSESPSQAICEFAESHDVDLIIVGSRGRSAIAKLLVGSVAEQVVRHAACAVLVAR